MSDLKKLLGISQSQENTAVNLLAEGLAMKLAPTGGKLVSTEAVKAHVGLESWTEDTRHQVQSQLTDLKSLLGSVVQKATVDLQSVWGADNGKKMMGLTPAQESAAVAGALLGSDLKTALGARPFDDRAVTKFSDVANLTVIGAVGMESTDARRVSDGRLAVEAFDNKENRNAVVHNMLYNLRASRQDDFGEAFFPTVLVNPGDVGYFVQVRINYVYDAFLRRLDGQMSDFRRRNVLKALVDPTILANDHTRVIPVVRSGSGVNNNTQFFASGITPKSIVVDNETVVTAPLAFGKKADLMALSQRDRLIAAGLLDQTDALDTSIMLEAIYVRLPAAGNKVIRFNVADLPGTHFNAAVQGNTRNMQLLAEFNSLHVKADRKTYDDLVINELTALGTHSVRLKTMISGVLNLQDGGTMLTSTDVEVNTITDDTGTQLDIKSGSGKTIADLFAGAEGAGYDLRVYFTNSNRRQRGRLVDTQTFGHLYTVPLLPPFTAQRPIGETDANDNDLVNSLVTLTRVQASIAAVAKLHETAGILKEYVNAKDRPLNQPEIFGVARELVNATYIEERLDVRDVDSLTSSDRSSDVCEMILNKIRDMAFRLFAQSQMLNALDSQYDGAAPKPTLIVGADQYIFRYLTQVGDTRTLSEHMDFKPVMTTNETMVGKLYMAFGLESAYNSGAPTPMHFGNMAWRPEATLMLPMQRGGAITHEMTVSPSFRHIVNVPVLGVLNIEGIEDIIAGKATLNANTNP